MRKIYYIISAVVLTFLLITRFNVSALSIDNVSEIRIFNLVWYEIEGGPSDTQYYDLVVEVQPGVYDEINAVIISEVDTLSLNGVIVFQYPRSLSSPMNQKTITFYPLSGSPIRYNNVDYMAIKKFTDRLELYINNDTYTYQPYDTRIEGFRMEYIADWDYQDGYNDGYVNGFTDGKAVANERAYEQGYIEGWNEGFEEGYDRGYNKAYEEIDENDEYMLGYNDGFKAGEESKIAQNSEAFYKSIEKWLVPAIITVILLGGIVSIIAIKRRE